MTYVVLLGVVLLITLLTTYMVVEHNRKKAIQQKKKRFDSRLNKIRTDYRNRLNVYATEKAIRPKHITPLNSIANNFFVVQPHTEDNLDILESRLFSVTTAFDSALLNAQATEQLELLQQIMLDFINALPSQGRDFNAEFYQNLLPKLLETVILPSAESDVERDEEEQNLSQEPESLAS